MEPTDGRSWRGNAAVRLLIVVSCFVGAAGMLLAQSLSPTALGQIQSVLEEKATRTPAQKKVNSNLHYEARQARGLAAAAGVPTLQTGIEVSPGGTVVVDITANVTKSVLGAIESLGGRVLSSFENYRSIRAELPLLAVETLAELPDVQFIQPRQEAMLNRMPPPALSATRGVTPALLKAVRPGFAARAAAVRSQLAAALKGMSGAKPEGTNRTAKTNTSQGVVTHRADLAVSIFGSNGTGVKVGVLSDGVDALASLQASGDLPGGVTVLSGQAGAGNEGAAMLEIVYDMAPGAQLYFATAFTSLASFATNIHSLQAAGCNVIIDDVSYFGETPFQMGQTAGVMSSSNGGLVMQAVNDVTAAGVLYFSSAANSGGKDKSTSGTWEGDFVDGGPAGVPITTVEPGRLHDFDPGAGVTAFDSLTNNSGVVPVLFWSDPLGGATNDYDLFLLNSAGTTIVGQSTDVQDGTAPQDPFEGIGVALTSGQRLVIVKFAGAARFLHLDTNRGKLTFNTQGSTHGHNAAAASNAFSVAATPAAAAFSSPPNPTGPYPNPFNATNNIEIFSSDGPRQFFFNADSSAITPGNFSSTGGVIRQKPDLTAADGVACAAPGFGSFFGTSAAAPHAGAIAALVKSRNPSLTSTQISSILMSSTIDIEAAGWDRDSGRGILDAFAAVQQASPTGSHFFTVAPCRVADTRNAPGPSGGPALAANTVRSFPVLAKCGIPNTATAVAVNLAVFLPSGGGDLRVYPAGKAAPLASAINFRPGIIRANNAVVPLGAGGYISIQTDMASGSTDFFFDVFGYFQP